jgi:hypothetical protein
MPWAPFATSGIDDNTAVDNLSHMEWCRMWEANIPADPSTSEGRHVLVADFAFGTSYPGGGGGAAGYALLRRRPRKVGVTNHR